MKNITVSYKTAVALKEAGFPQPKPQTGQFWWHKHPSRAKTLDFVQDVEIIEKNECFYTIWVGDEDTGGNFYTCNDHNLIFAPQAHDILEQMGWEYYLLFEQTGQQWFCNKPNDETGIWCDKNPHEAAAKAYLFQKNVT